MAMTLTTTLREERGKKVKALRAQGFLPCVMYGAKQTVTALSVSQKDFEKMFSEAGESTVIVLTGVGADKEVLVQDVAYDPVHGQPVHVDFFAVDQSSTLTVHVPLEFVGESPATKTGGAVLTKVLHEIEVECFPKNIPQEILVDVSGLMAIDDSIHVKDLPKIEGVEYLADPEDVVVIASGVADEVEEEPQAIDMASIDVEKKGKKEEEPAE